MATIVDRLFLFMNGALLGNADSGQIEGVGDPVIVDTLSEDFIGVYPVPKHLMCTIEQFEPASGTNFDPMQPWIDTELVTFKGQLGGSGKILEADGFIMGPSIQSSPTNPTKWTFKVAIKAIAFK